MIGNRSRGFPQSVRNESCSRQILLADRSLTTGRRIKHINFCFQNLLQQTFSPIANICTHVKYHGMRTMDPADGGPDFFPHVQTRSSPLSDKIIQVSIQYPAGIVKPTQARDFTQRLGGRFAESVCKNVVAESVCESRPRQLHVHVVSIHPGSHTACQLINCLVSQLDVLLVKISHKAEMDSCPLLRSATELEVFHPLSAFPWRAVVAGSFGNEFAATRPVF